MFNVFGILDCLLPALIRKALTQSRCVETTRYDKNAFRFAREYLQGDARRHVLFPRQTPLALQGFLGRIFPRQRTVCIEMGKPERTVLIEAVDLKIFFPELVKAAQSRLFAQAVDIIIAREQIVVIVVSRRFSLRELLRGRCQNIPVRQVDKGHVCLNFMRLAQCGKLR